MSINHRVLSLGNSRTFPKEIPYYLALTKESGVRSSGKELKPLSLVLGDPDDQAVRDAMKIAGPSTPEEYRVFGHGDSEHIVGLNADQVAARIRNDPEYIGGKQDVILYSCETGKHTNGFAQQLADNLGVKVVAPNRLLYPDIKNNKFHIKSPAPGGKSYWPGSWVDYYPKKYY